MESGNMGHFQIKRGYKSTLLDDAGTPLIPLDDGCWYLTLDTAEVFVALTINDSLNLYKINEAPIDLKEFNDRFDAIEVRLDDIDDRLSSFEENSTSDVLSYIDRSQFPTTGALNKLYIDITENISYRWDANSNEYIALAGDSDIEISLINGGSATN